MKKFFTGIKAAFSRANLQKVVTANLQSITTDLQDDLAQANAERLFDTGKDMKGRSLGKYAPKTIEIKQAKGQPFDRVTLRDTQAFQNSITLRITKRGFEYFATDEKTDSLIFRYGPDILGLSESDWNKVKPVYVDRLIAAVKGSLRK